MFDIEKEIAAWTSSLRRNRSLEPGDRAELERYLRDKIEDLTGQGLSPKEAFETAAAEFRRADGLDAAFRHAHGVRPGGRFPWRPGRFSMDLARSHIRLTWRRLRLQKVHSLINIGGLALGLSSCLLAFLWIRDEVRYDRFHEHAASIAQVYYTSDPGDGSRTVQPGSFYPLAAGLKAECPEVVEAARLEIVRGLAIRAEDRVFDNDAVALADPSLFRIFTFPFVRGNPDTALADKFAVVLTESMARKYFGDRDPIGQTLRVNGEFDVQVSAVIRDIPTRSSLRFDAVVPFVLQFAPSFEEPTHWGGNPLGTWVRLSPGADPAALEAKITSIARTREPRFAGRVDFHLHPLFRKRLHSPDGYSLSRMIMLFSGAALFLLALAAVNFTTLSTARAITRAKEIGVRKTIGARRSDIVRQFLGESLGTSFLALGAALALVALALPLFNRIAAKELSIDAVLEPWTILGFLAITAIAGLAAGAYPAFALSSFRAGAVLTGRSGGGPRHSAGLRKGLVVLQFALSFVLVLGTAVVGRQISFIKTKDLGFDRRGLVTVPMGPALAAGFETFRTELLRTPGIAAVTASFQNPVNIGSTVFQDGVDWEGKDPQTQATLHWDYVSYDYFETLKTPFAAGRSFSRDFPSDAQGAFVINEAAARLMGLAEPVGTRMRVFKTEGPIVGVVRDFHFRPLRFEIRPMVFQLRTSARSRAFIRIDPGTEAASLKAVADAARRIDPDALAPVVFFDDLMLESQYFIEQKIRAVANVLSAVALAIAGLGLLGLASFLTQQRTKEIGIRKVMGASSAGLAARLSREFLKWVGLAIALAFPIAFWVSGKILSTYAYRASIGLPIYVLAGLAILLVAAVAVGSQTLRASRANPVETLRYE